MIGYVSGPSELMAKVLYGTGLRRMECRRLRVKDIDFAQHQIVVRDGKGMEDRVTVLPASLAVSLQEHLAGVKRLHAQDLTKGYGSAYLAFALERKYPRAGRLWIWQDVFASNRMSRDPAQRPSAGITPVRAVCNEPLARQVARQRSPSALIVIP